MTTYSDEAVTQLREDARAEHTRLDLVDPNATLPPETEDAATLPPEAATLPPDVDRTQPGVTPRPRAPTSSGAVRIGPGARFDRYELDKHLGSGAFGRVFAARDTRLGRRLAIKILHPDQAAIPEIRQRFLQEAHAAACIAHPGIVTVFDVGELTANGTAYIAMELLDGESLQTRIGRGALPSAPAREIARQVASALDAAHRAGVIHRDLKPENIFIVPDPAAAALDRAVPRERAKILDFGLAKPTQSASVRTRAATVFGTPAYMSPEQCRSTGDIDHRSDIYALGCIVFEMLTGKPPFLGTLRELVGKHCNEVPADLTAVVPGVDPKLAALVARMLAKDPAARPASMGEIERALSDDRPEALGSGPHAIEAAAPVDPAAASGELAKTGGLRALFAAAFRRKKR
ncbi:MAG: serine/threonine protein kinase [Deltaproteobacteria bacterium]|nr:serine/threonine protein kinase [Deltaproteobacteria bacterium]